MLRNSNAALHIRVSGLEVELAKKDRELTELIKKLHEGKPAGSANIPPQLVVQQRGGRMFMNPERKEALATGGANAGGEDKRAVVSVDGAVRRQWRMPNEKPVWTGCWTAANKVTLGLGDGRVLEYAVDSDSTEPLRDYTQGVGHLPIIFTGFDPASSTLLVASFKKLVA
ncbi:hypothetical protein COOONC_25889, partial [Cooperia oncophora]